MNDDRAVRLFQISCVINDALLAIAALQVEEENEMNAVTVSSLDERKSKEAITFMQNAVNSAAQARDYLVEAAYPKK